MPDREKVINALTLCTTQFDISVAVAPCKQCPYYTGQDLCDIRQMMLDTIELLKEQEPVPLIHSAGNEEYWDIESICPKCNTRWISLAEDHFCPQCGQAVKWDA